jgi:hypothetical protein
VRRYLSNRISAVVAANAIAGNVNVVKISWYPAIAGMAVVAAVTAIDVVLILARCNGSVMA